MGLSTPDNSRCTPNNLEKEGCKDTYYFKYVCNLHVQQSRAEFTVSSLLSFHQDGIGQDRSRLLLMSSPSYSVSFSGSSIKEYIVCYLVLKSIQKNQKNQRYESLLRFQSLDLLKQSIR